MWTPPRRAIAVRWPATAALPNYRAYWKEAGYVDEMTAVEAAIDAKEIRPHPAVSLGPLAGRHHALRHAVASARRHRGLVDAGIKTPIIVPSSASGGQFQAFDEFFAIWE